MAVVNIAILYAHFNAIKQFAKKEIMALPATTENEGKLSVDDALSLALNHHRNESIEVAENLYRLILGAQPSHPVAMANLASICAATNRLAEALEYLRHAAALYPNVAAFRCNLGIYLKRDGQYEAACEEFSQVLSLDPSNGLAKYGLAEALKHLNRFDEAVAIYSPLIVQGVSGTEFDFNSFLDIPFHHEPFPLKYILLTIKGGFFDRTELRQAWEILMRESSPCHLALEKFSQRVAAIQLDLLACILLALMWRHLFETGWYDNPEQANSHPFKPIHLLKICRNGKLLGRALESIGISLSGSRTMFFDGGLRLNVSSSREWNALIVHQLILPTIAALNEDENHLIYLLDIAIKFSFAQQPHTEEQSEYCDKLVRPVFRTMGIKLAGLAPLKQVYKRPSGHQIPRVAFVYDVVMNRSSPVVVLLNFFKGCLRCNGKVVQPVIYAFTSVTADVKKDIDSLGFELFDMKTESRAALYDDVFTDRFLYMAKHIRNNRIDAVVYVTTDAFLNLAGAFRILPVQLFWSMGFTYQQAPNIAAYIYNGTFERFMTANGRTWRIGRAGLDWFNPELRKPGREFRQKNSTSEIVLAHLGRTQKINNEAFLNMLNEILVSRPQVGFLYTGHVSIPRIDEFLSMKGVSERCKFVGSVDGKMFVHAIDILLDSWPFGGGHSVCEAMMAGVAVVFYRYDYMKEPGALRSILLAYDGIAGTEAEQADVKRIFTGKNGRNLLLVADNPEQYRDMVHQLIDDPAFRSEVGEAGRIFTEKYLSDVNQMALSYSAHIIEAIDDYWDSQENVAASYNIFGPF